MKNPGVANKFNSQLTEEKQYNTDRLSSFPNDLLQSEAFIAASQGRKSLGMSKLDFTDDDI